jgi:tetratricopeptide (TPR) repeat protein
MAEAYRRVGGIREQLGEAKEAVVAYKEALAVSSKLATEFPDDRDYRQNLARSYASLGGGLGSYLFKGRDSEQESAYAEALRIQEQLVQEDPGNLEYQHDVGWTYFLLGLMHILGGRPAEAEGPVRRALAIRERLVAARPTKFSYRQELGMSLGNLSVVLTRTRRFEEAQAVARRALEVRQQLVNDFPAAPEARHYLADAYMDLGESHYETGQFREAAEALRHEVSLRQKLAAEFPSLFKYQVDFAEGSMRLGRAVCRMGAQQEATAVYKTAIAACKEAIRLQPQHSLPYSFWGEALDRTGAGKEAVADWEQAVQRGTNKARGNNIVAWVLATALNPQMQNPAKAVQMARQATDLTPQNGSFWNTLGVACYRARQWKEAVAALKKAMQLRSGGNSGDWFFLAMAHWQLDERKQARHWYDQAVQWMDKNNPYEEDLCRFRAEASALLGIAEQPLRKQSTTNTRRSGEKDSTP